VACLYLGNYERHFGINSNAELLVDFREKVISFSLRSLISKPCSRRQRHIEWTVNLDICLVYAPVGCDELSSSISFARDH
jgi:hypothetical protein